VFTLRFDMRSATADHYAAAIEMTRWAEHHGAMAVVVSEHHGSPDGYLPAPLALVSALAAATSTIALQVGALIVPLHDPVELAETMAVIDLISQGRVSYICGAGYRPAEFDMFGQSLEGRGRRLEESIQVMRQAWTGEPFTYDSRPCRVTPAPHTAGGPTLWMGGGTKTAVRRAARLGMGMLTERSAGLTEVYEQECERLGVAPGFFIEVPPDSVTAAFVADDPDAAWDQIGPYILHDATAYKAWNDEAEHRTPAVSITGAQTVDELRVAPSPYRIFTPDEAVTEIQTTGYLNLHPLCGGIPPELAWTSLELLADEVLPRLS
jgi:alkanesulfonate monooxygenase SsuD/methylene tetrahydromethanopterin reductase-like flavin-dependent oxidoreductase (luciferase family)